MFSNKRAIIRTFLLPVLTDLVSVDELTLRQVSNCKRFSKVFLLKDVLLKALTHFENFFVKDRTELEQEIVHELQVKQGV